MTEISCKLCDKKIIFNLEDPKTYIHKSESGNPMIGKLYTVRLGHPTESDTIHINVVVIDDEGIYRAHKDYYEEKQRRIGMSDLWDKILHQIPLELRAYLSLANNEEKKIFSTIPQPFSKLINEWYNIFIKMKNENPNSQLFTFLVVKWSFIIGKGKELMKETYKPDSWSFPIYLRLQARFTPSPELIEKAKRMDFSFAPVLIQLEEAVAKAELFLRLSSYDLLEELFKDCQNMWGKETSLEIKSALMLVQGYYAFGQYFLGRINEAIALIEPVFNFGQIIENREIIGITGNFYAAILQSSGELERPLNIYNIVLKLSEEMGDERTQAVVSTNISIIESKQGLYDQALKRQKTILDYPIVQEEFFLKFSMLSIIAETLFVAERYDEAIETCKTVLLEENLATYYQIDVLSTLKKIAGKTESYELLEFVKTNLPKDKEFLDSPAGQIFNYDLQAINAELDNDWVKMIENLKLEREIMFENKLVEDASDIEIRLAQGYFKLYQETNELEYLNHSYNHLDLAKTIALEKQSYLDLCRLDILKGLLAVESKMNEQAKIHFDEALKIAKEYKLVNLEKAIVDHLNQLTKGTIEITADSILRKIFRRLTFRKTEEKQPKKSSIIYTIWIENQDLSWRILLQNEKEGNSQYTNYLLGFRDLWNIIEKNKFQQQVNYISLSKGAVLIEKSSNFQLIALCNQLDYLTRLTIQNLLPSLEDFSLKYIHEELSDKVIELIENNLTSFIRVE